MCIKDIKYCKKLKLMKTLFCFRCGIMHARGVVPSSRVTPTELEDYCTTFEKKMGQSLNIVPNKFVISTISI